MKKDRLIIIVFLLGLISGIFLIRRNQYFRSLAQIPASSGNVILEVERMQDVNNMFKVDMMVRTGSEAQKTETISTLATRIKINKSTRLVDSEGNTASGITASTEFLQDAWEFPVNEITGNGEDTYINFAGANIDLDGYSSSEFKKIATFYVVTANPESVMSFDQEISKMYSKRRPTTNIWNTASLNSFKITP